MLRFGREFYKLSGSGNDFIFIDARSDPAEELTRPQVVSAVCARGTGVGADGIVFLELSTVADFRIRYLNSDGSPALLCGNAALCSARLAIELGVVEPRHVAFETGAGVVSARVGRGTVEVDLEAPSEVRDLVPEVTIEAGAGERRIGYAVVGVPHAVVLCDDVRTVDLERRGRELRRHPVFAEGANVNFVSSTGDGWRYRTFERGVEGETLACGTGAVSCAVMLRQWGVGRGTVQLRTRSGHRQTVRLREVGGTLRPSLEGEARVVYRGALGEYL